MPLMRDWTEITVEEDLLISVVQELLSLTNDPNHVEVIHGVSGRIILAEAALAERWYHERVTQNGSKEAETMAHAHGSEVVDTEVIDTADSTEATEDLVPLPVRRGPGRPRKNPFEVPSPPLNDGEEL